jgi:glycerol-3-phosphate acyltransferase PlsY
MTLLAIPVVIAGYLLGSIPFSYLVARRFGVADVRKEGSGNVGATNVLRSAGKAAGITAFVLDFAKGVGASWGAVLVSGDVTCGVLAAAAAVLGHMFPVWLSFKGGKGVATGAGVFLPLAPAAVGIAIAVFAVTAALTRYVSLGSVAGTSALVVSTFLLGSAPVVSWGALGLGLLIVLKHRANLERIVRGRESRVGRPKAEET